MELVVLSPEGEDPRERDTLPRLFAAGLRRYHVRKPGWPVERLRAWLSAFPAELRRRMMPHSHPALVEELDLAGWHVPDDPRGPVADGDWPARAGWTPSHPQAVPGLAEAGRGQTPGLQRRTSRSCHDLRALESALGRYDSVFFGPVFPSFSKAGRAPDPRVDRAALAALLHRGDPARRSTSVIALGGIAPDRVDQCARMGFDGVGVIGAVWQAADPLAAFRALQTACGSAAARPARRTLPRLMCLTQDGLAVDHEDQVRRLCDAGAKWIQVRMKHAEDAERRRVAAAAVRICREHRAVCIINDRIDIALESGADGVHLGRTDGDWRQARGRLGPAAIIGGTVNDEADAARAVEARCLDYAGVGPFRFTRTKLKLAPVLGADGIGRLVRRLDGLPAWAIGGITAADLPELLSAGAAGVAVSGALYAGGAIEANVRAFLDGVAAVAGPGRPAEAAARPASAKPSAILS